MGTARTPRPARQARDDTAEAVQRTRQILEESIPQLWTASQGLRLIRDLPTLNPRMLLLLMALLRCWILDGVIRLIGERDEPRASEGYELVPVSGQEMQQQAEEILLRGDLLEALAKLLLQTQDEVSVVGILTLLLHLRAVTQETERRLARLRQGPEWVALMQDANLRTACRRMAVLANAPSVHGKPLWKSWRLPKDSTANGAQERVDVAMEAMTRLYDQVRRGEVAPVAIGEVPSPFAGRGKPVPRWDAVALHIQQEDIADLQRTFLPAFEMEKGRLRILDAFKARHEAASAQKRTGDEVALDEPDVAQGQKNLGQALKKTRRAVRKHVRAQRLLDYARAILSPKMARAVELFAEGLPQNEAAKAAGVTAQGFRKALERLRADFPKDADLPEEP